MMWAFLQPQDMYTICLTAIAWVAQKDKDPKRSSKTTIEHLKRTRIKSSQSSDDVGGSLWEDSDSHKALTLRGLAFI